MKNSRNLHQNQDEKITFFKILIRDFTNEMMVPCAFVTKYWKTMPRTLTLKSHNIGKFYTVAVIRNHDGSFLKHGWPKFVEENDLKLGDFLVFNLVDVLTFEVLIYGPTCLLKNINLSNENDEDDGHVDQTKNLSNGSVYDGDDDEEEDQQKNGASKMDCAANSIVKNRGRPKKSQVSATQIAEKNPNLFKERTEFVLKYYQKYNLDPAGRLWPVAVKILSGHQVQLSSGWSDFYQANGLATGDTVVLFSKQGFGELILVEVRKGRGEVTSTKPGVKLSALAEFETGN
ncbi:B3 domain-containing protein REM9-like isoform X2 [Mercurialis annua]|uniref:B3 domain-containing protein REM9-like isoform X2 n=1 Tax=Mercurialis annua TaxID=3986 RepID=UPI0021605ABD|nr:B3 domain-containing protein REM9-like isoform X2 [Mercurialis annua]